MPGPVALVGAGEFLPAMLDFDLELLAEHVAANTGVTFGHF